MSFIDIVFPPFLVAVFLLYFLLPLKYRWYVLLAASLAFYGSWGWEKFPFALLAVLTAWLAGRGMGAVYSELAEAVKQEPDRKKKRELQAAARKKCRHFLFPAVFVLLLLLVGVKAGRLFADAITTLLSGSGLTFAVIVPLGISYYTLTLIGYLADVYWNKEPAEPNFLKLCLFALYFPHILQGPISRHKKLAGQLVEGHRFEYKRFCFGIQLMLWGYFKKLVIADRLAQFVNTVFDACGDYSGAMLLVGAVFGSIQLYCDFSGCMDMAQGMSEVLGITLEKNFNHPFFSASAAEFWRRWHITLGAWFKDYIYMPLVVSPRVMKAATFAKQHFGKRAGKAMVTVIPLTVVWILTGLWHGTGWNYLVWGIYWGTLIIVSNVFEPEIKGLNRALHINTEAGSFHVFRQVRTFLIFTFGRILTLPGTLEGTGTVLRQFVNDFRPWELVDGTIYTAGLDRPNFLLALAAILLLWGVSLRERRGSVREQIAESNVAIRWAVYYALFFAVLVFGIYGTGYDASAFVYMNY